MTRPATVTLHMDALQANLNRVQQLAPQQKIIAMIKANAYGHGIIRVAKALTQADAFGVACIEEAVTLREAGIDQPIVLMEGIFQEAELHLAHKLSFTLVVHKKHHIELLKKHGYPHPIWLKIDTGMHRLGIDPKEAQHAYSQLAALNPTPPWIGFMTHFADADLLDLPTTKDQIGLFTQAIQSINAPLSLANSAAILAWPEALGNWVRPGLMLYGASPFLNKTGQELLLQPAMTLSSQLITIRKVNPGDAIGYGGTWRASQATHIGVVGIGYGDGYPQYAKANTPVLINGKIYPLVGRVSMDMLTVDLGPQLNCDVGTPVILWGKGLPIEHVAANTYSSPWELLTRVTARPNFLTS